MKRYQKYLAALFVVLLACVGYLLISQASTISREQAITIAEDAGITEIASANLVSSGSRDYWEVEGMLDGKEVKAEIPMGYVMGAFGSIGGSFRVDLEKDEILILGGGPLFTINGTVFVNDNECDINYLTARDRIQCPMGEGDIILADVCFSYKIPLTNEAKVDCRNLTLESGENPFNLAKYDVKLIIYYKE